MDTQIQVDQHIEPGEIMDAPTDHEIHAALVALWVKYPQAKEADIWIQQRTGEPIRYCARVEFPLPKNEGHYGHGRTVNAAAQDLIGQDIKFGDRVLEKIQELKSELQEYEEKARLV